MALSAAAMILALIAVTGLACALIGLWWNMCDRRSATAGKLMLIGLACLIASGAWARDDGRYAQSPLKPWFNELKSSGGALCCSGSDGTVIEDADWDTKNGHYRVRLEGEWIDVPDDAVVNVPNRAGKTMVWPVRGYMGMTIRCFMPGEHDVAMLNRIEWDRKRFAVTTPYSLAAFVAWLDRQPGDKQYRWQEYRGCVVHDYLLSVTGEEPDLSAILYSDVFASPHDYRLVCEAKPHSYGAARLRAVALLARLGQPGGA